MSQAIWIYSSAEQKGLISDRWKKREPTIVHRLPQKPAKAAVQ